MEFNSIECHHVGWDVIMQMGMSLFGMECHHLKLTEEWNVISYNTISYLRMEHRLEWTVIVQNGTLKDTICSLLVKLLTCQF